MRLAPSEKNLIKSHIARHFRLFSNKFDGQCVTVRQQNQNEVEMNRYGYTKVWKSLQGAYDQFRLLSEHVHKERSSELVMSEEKTNEGHNQ